MVYQISVIVTVYYCCYYYYYEKRKCVRKLETISNFFLQVLSINILHSVSIKRWYICERLWFYRQFFTMYGISITKFRIVSIQIKDESAQKCLAWISTTISDLKKRIIVIINIWYRRSNCVYGDHNYLSSWCIVYK